MKEKDRKDAIETLLESWSEQDCDDAVWESRQRYLEDDNYLDWEEHERERLRDLTDDELQDEFQEMLATEFGYTLKENSVQLKAEIQADDNLRPL